MLGVLADGPRVSSEVRVPHPQIGMHYAASFFEVENGRLASGREYWVEERYEKPASERARWFEPM